MEEYKQWLEQQIERCLNDKDLQREHLAFCKAYEKFTALSQPSVSGSCNHSFVWINSNDDNDLDRRCEICGFVDLHDH